LPGFPRYKSYRRYDSFTFKQSGFNLLDNGLLLSKIGVVKIVQHRAAEGEIKNPDHPARQRGQLVCFFFMRSG
jgi:putative transposase